MSKSKFTPENVKQDFYNKYSNVSNYKELTIKKNNVTTNLKNLFNKNIWNLKDQAQELEKKQIIEHNNIYNGFLSDVYLLDYNKQPKIKTMSLCMQKTWESTNLNSTAAPWCLRPVVTYRRPAT
jgi:hypothetical protein